MIMYYGFDIGGTKIALGVFDETLKLQWETRVPTPRESYDEFLTAIAALVAQADARFGVKGSVGIGIPGMPETDDGTLYAANVPAASGKPLRADLSRLLDRDVRLDNDANCFALSEAWDDEFRRYPLVMGLILGTGVGGGIIIDGKPITGRSYITGEFGHIRLPVDALEVVGRDFPLTRCGCGQHGCIENYLSGRGFAWLYEHFYHQKLQAPEIIALWDQGDVPHAKIRTTLAARGPFSDGGVAARPAGTLEESAQGVERDHQEQAHGARAHAGAKAEHTDGQLRRAGKHLF
jgi:N-acetylglucosamine kinase